MKNRPLIRYALLQIPHAALIGLLLFLLVAMEWMDPMPAIALWSLWIIKDMALYPLTRKAYEIDAKTGLEALCGASGIATEEIGPTGFIRIKGEIWKATLHPDSKQSVKKGEEVLVVDCKERLLRVMKAHNESSE